MQPILVAYATTEGQTRKVAEFIAGRLRRRDHLVDLVDVATPAADALKPRYRAAFVGGSVHYGHHQTDLYQFLRNHLEWVNAMPVAFFSLGLSAVDPDAGGVEDARRAADQFLEQTGLRPLRVRLVRGALSYTPCDRHDFFKRWVMRMIATREGVGRGDLAHDHEYTDWADVEAFVDEFLAAARRR